jgi:hypothetical protein
MKSRVGVAIRDVSISIAMSVLWVATGGALLVSCSSGPLADFVLRFGARVGSVLPPGPVLEYETPSSIEIPFSRMRPTDWLTLWLDGTLNPQSVWQFGWLWHLLAACAAVLTWLRFSHPRVACLCTVEDAARQFRDCLIRASIATLPLFALAPLGVTLLHGIQNACGAGVWMIFSRRPAWGYSAEEQTQLVGVTMLYAVVVLQCARVVVARRPLYAAAEQTQECSNCGYTRSSERCPECGKVPIEVAAGTLWLGRWHRAACRSGWIWGFRVFGILLICALLLAPFSRALLRTYF